MENFKFDLQIFADAGTVVNATGGYVNSGTGEVTGFTDGKTLSPELKAFYDTGLTAGEKQLVSMGAYICVFPDKKYYNTADAGNHGSMEAYYTSTGTVKYTMCRADGTEYARPAVSAAAPEEPENAALWIDTSQEKHVLKQWSSASKEWVCIHPVRLLRSMGAQGQDKAQGDEHSDGAHKAAALRPHEDQARRQGHVPAVLRGKDNIFRE